MKIPRVTVLPRDKRQVVTPAIGLGFASAYVEGEYDRSERRLGAQCSRAFVAKGNVLDARSIAVLDALIEEASLALFDGIGVTLGRAPAPVKSADDISASIGFAGPAFRGALVLISTRRLVQFALPREIHDRESDEHVADWMGELANQLLGRVKNKLHGYGVSFAMGTPTVMLGMDLSRKDKHPGVRRQFAFRHAGDSLSVCLDAIASPNLTLLPDEPATSGIAEGEVALF
jgi:CheY-specific phosphatase CheX